MRDREKKNEFNEKKKEIYEKDYKKRGDIKRNLNTKQKKQLARRIKLEKSFISK